MYEILDKVFASPNKIQNVLDVGAGNGNLSVHCASFGAKVDAIDKKKFPDNLAKNPLVTLIQSSIEEFKFTKNYDLIILRAILPFLAKSFTTKELFGKIINHLNNGGFLYVLSFSKEDQNFPSLKENLYNTDELIDYLKPLKVIKQKEETRKDNHLPIGEHTHQIQEFLFQK